MTRRSRAGRNPRRAAIRCPGPLERLIDRVPFLEKELLLLRRIVRPGDVCLDVGAAGGAHLVVMARRAGTSGTVVGIEPRPASLRSLRRVVRLARVRSRVTLLGIALDARAGRARMHVPVVATRAHLHRSGSRVGAAFGRLPHREIDVPTRTLDDVVGELALPRVDVVKCDVEGAELAVLDGARWVLDELRPVVVIEAEDRHLRRVDARAQDVIDRLAGHGYRVYRFRRGALEPVEGAVPGENDYVALPTERPVPVPVATR